MDNIRIIFVLSEKYNEESDASQTMLETFEVILNYYLHSF